MPPHNQAGGVPAELALRLRQQELVARFGRFALDTSDLQAILDEASRLAGVGLEVRLTKVLQYLPEDGDFLVRAGTGWRPGIVGHARVGGGLASPAGYAFRTHAPVVANDLAHESRFRVPALLVEHGVRSAINVHIRTAQEDFGVLEVDSTDRGAFGDADVAFLQGLANMLAVAISAQQREQLRERTLREKEALLRENQQLLHDKDLLAREIHHRVTNSLQLVHSALVIQLRTLRDSEARTQVAQAAGRVLAIAAVHRRLYKGGSPVAADCGEYLRGLVDEMRELLPPSGDRGLALESEAMRLSADQLANLGLIVVELVTNALKHGRGRVTVVVRRGDGAVMIAVSDEGGGFPAGFEPRTGTGLGLQIVASLTGPARAAAIAIDRSVPFSRIMVTMPL
ncbi:MAG: sensor histidine kinase [Pseudomonadota bacterium]